MGNITLNHITKIEGHARLDLEVKDNKVKKCELGSIEGSRYFEGLLKGRKYNEVQEITTRICGICSSAHNVAAIIAMEKALNVVPSKQTIALRQLQTIGERIRSHATHLYFLALPDYLGYESAIPMASKYRKEIARAIRLMKLGNDIVRLLTGRVIHPISPTIGGFLHFPKQDDLDVIRDRLDKAKKDIIDTNILFSRLKYPSYQREETQYMSIVKDDEFGTSNGDIQIGDDVYDQSKFHNFVREYHEPFSTANFAVREGKSYYVGAMARINNSLNLLSSETKSFMKDIPMHFPSCNPFHNNIAQALELLHYREECITLLDNFCVQKEELAEIKMHKGHGIAANEAPRGTLWHEYKINDKGVLRYANILTPTAQFLRNLNEDIYGYVQQMLEHKKKKGYIVKEIEKLIRSYDPCFSCASHFLRVNWH